MSDSLALTTEERSALNLSSRIQGWGADADPMDRPGVPRDQAPTIGVDALYPPFEPQIPKVKILKSIEHMQMTPVFGTSCPPQLLSGAIREYAYTFSEGRFSHWLMLMAADRVNVVEDLIQDISEGRFPNLWKEMGLNAEWKYNRTGLLKKAAILGLGAFALIALSRARAERRASSIQR